MNDATDFDAGTDVAARRSNRSSMIAGGLALAWFIVLCVVPDPRPLGAPEWAVDGVRSIAGVSEATARFVATVAFRAAGLGILGVLLALSLKRLRLRWAAPLTLGLALLLAVAAKRINFGYFPTNPQLQLIVAAAILGALAGLALRRSWIAITALVILAAGLFAWGASRGVPDDVYEAARATGLHVLEYADDVPSGDEGFARIIEVAFAYAEDNSHGTSAVPMNEAAILALGVILGEQRVARAGKREIDLGRLDGINALRRRISLQGRGDLSQHFWVSAALVVILDEGRALTVGTMKELKDSTPGGSGFSFVDMAANKAGIMFAVAATRDAESARAVQLRIADGVQAADFLPPVTDLPEDIPRDTFQAEFGGLGGAETRGLFDEIDRRLATREALR